MQKQKGITLIIFIIIIIVLLAVVGFFAYQYFSAKTNNQSQVQSNQQNQTDQTAGWKTYTNTEYGFEFQYPQTESVNLINHVPPHGTDLVLQNNNFIEKDGSVGSVLTFSIFQKATSNLEGYISSDLASSNAVNAKYGLPQSSYQKININGIGAYEIKYPNSIFRIYIQNSEHTLLFQYNGDNNTTAQQIISTFKFTK